MYQSLLRGVETLHGCRCSRPYRSINRSFVELKHNYHRQGTHVVIGINRSFVELKLYGRTSKNAA